MKKLSISIFLCFFTVLAGWGASDGSTKLMRNLVVEGNKLFKDEKIHEALEKYNAALAIDSTYQYAMYNKAVALVQLATDDNKGTENDPRQQAAQLFSRIAQLKTVPSLAEKSFYNLGNMAYNDEQYGQAIDMYKGSLRIRPDNRECRQNLLLALKKKEEQEQNQDKQDQQEDKQDQEQQQQQQQQQEQEQQQQQPQEQPMTQSAEQLLQAMQNKENATRRKTEQREPQAGRRSTDKPW